MGKVSDEGLADQTQAALDREDELLQLALVQKLLANADTCREALARCKREVKQAERRLEESELAVRAELRRLPRRKVAP